MMKKKYFDVFLVLGLVWIIVGFVIYKNTALLPLGALFLIIGLIRIFGKQKNED